MSETATAIRAEVLPLQPPEIAAPTVISAQALILSDKNMQHMMSVADLMAKSVATVPKHLQGNQGDCLAIVMQALQWGMNPFAVAQKTHVVSGTLGYEAQLVNAVITTMAPTKDRLHFDWFGPWENVIGKFEEKTNKNGDKYRKLASSMADEKGCGVKAWATLKGETSPRELNLLLTQARTRNSTLWADDPKQQLAYLAIKRWARLYCPDVILGVYTPDELQEPINMGSVEMVTDAESKPEVKFYPDAGFQANLPTWADLILSGKKTASQIIVTVSKKFPLTEAQTKTLHAIVKKEPEGEPATAQQIADIRAAAAEAAISDADIFKKFDITTLDGLPLRLVDPIMAFVANPTGE